MNVPAAVDILQTTEHLEIPEIRVWCHPRLIEESGDDYWYVFDSFSEATRFIQTHPEAQREPLIAFRGYELNLWAIKPHLQESAPEKG